MNSLLFRSSKAVAGVVRSSSRVSGFRAAACTASPKCLPMLQRVGAAGTVPFQRCFSSASENLSAILAKELDEELHEKRDEMPAILSELNSTIEKDWKIVDDGAMTRLIRSIDGSKVVLSFHCQDTVDGEEESFQDDEDEPPVPFRFEILVSKAGNTLVLNCISNAGETTVDGVAMTTEDIESVQSNGVGRSRYQGPEFPELAEEVQEAFQEYVYSDLGVNEDVSTFVSMYADYKEQIEYIGFLKGVGKVL